MKSETLLPLGKLDPGLREPENPLQVSEVASAEKHVDAIGYDDLVVENNKDDPVAYTNLTLPRTHIR